MFILQIRMLFYGFHSSAKIITVTWWVITMCRCNVWAVVVRPNGATRSINEQTRGWRSVWQGCYRAIFTKEQPWFYHSQSWSKRERVRGDPQWQMHHSFLSTQLLVCIEAWLFSVSCASASHIQKFLFLCKQLYLPECWLSNNNNFLLKTSNCKGWILHDKNW